MSASRAYTVPSVFVAIDQFSAPVKAMGGALGSFVNTSNTAFASINRGWRRMMTPFMEFNRMLQGAGLFIGLYSLFRILKSGLNVIAQWEQSQINVKSVSTEALQVNRALGLEARKTAVAYGQQASKVAELQYELEKMGFSGSQVLKMTSPISTGARALKTTPERLAEITGAILLSYKKDASEAGDVINKMAYIANLTAADFESYATQLPIINSVAKLSGQTYEKTLVYLGVLRNMQIHTATGSTSLKNIFIDTARRGEDFRKAVEKLAGSKNPLVYGYKQYGKKTVVTAVTLASQLKEIDALLAKVQNTPSDYVNRLAQNQQSGLLGKFSLIKSAYEEFIISIDDGTGKIGSTIKGLLDIGRAALLLAADTYPANSALAKMDDTTVIWGYRLKEALKWVTYLTGAVILVRVAFFLWNTVVMATTLVMGLWNVAMGIAVALGFANAYALRGSRVAMLACLITTKAITAATWLWTAAQSAVNAAMLANPIGLFVIAILAVLTAVTLVVVKWNEWGAALSVTLGAFGLLLSAIMSISSKWDGITSAFSNEGIISGIKAIGMALLDAIIYPMQQFLQMMSNLPDFLGGKTFAKAAEIAKLSRQYYGFELDENGNKFSEKDIAMKLYKTLNDSTENSAGTKQKVQINFGNVPEGTKIDSTDRSIIGSIRPSVHSTTGAFAMKHN